MDKETANIINEEIDQVIKEFLKYNIQLLSKKDDLYDYFETTDLVLTGITGAAELCKNKEQLITADPENMDYERKAFREILELKLRDISFCSAVAKLLVGKFVDEIEESRRKLTSRKGSIEFALESIRKFDDEITDEEAYSKLLSQQERLTGCLNSLDIKVDYYDDTEYEGIWNKEYLVAILEQELQKSKDGIARFEKDFGDNNRVKSTIGNLETDIQEDIAAFRNKDAHDGMDVNQFSMDIRERAKAFREHIRKWYPVYKIRKKVDKLDEFHKKATNIYRKFDSNEDISVTIGGQECRNLTELIQAMYNNWDLGVELLKANQSIPELIKNESEILFPTYEILYGIVSAVKKREQERKIDEITGAKKRREEAVRFDASVYDDYKIWYDACMFKFIYGIMPECEEICWRGNVQKPEEFIKKNIFPLLKQKKYEAVKKIVSKSELDILAEYGLISYYCLQKNESGNEYSYNIDRIRDIELSILKIFETENDKPVIPLYEFYENLIDLADEFKVPYRYAVNGLGSIRYIQDKSELIDLIMGRLKEGYVETAYDLIEANSFANFRGWLCSKYKEKKKDINEFFNWYLEVKAYLKTQENDYDLEDDYFVQVDINHSEYKPVSIMELICMVCCRFMKMILDDSLQESECIYLIRGYYQTKSGILDINGTVPVETAGIREIIPFNLFRPVRPEKCLSGNSSQYNAEENAHIWSLIKGMVFDQRLLMSFDNNLFKSIYEYVENIPKSVVGKSKFLLKKYYNRICYDYTSVNTQLSMIISRHYEKKEEECFALCPFVSENPIENGDTSFSALKQVRNKLINDLNTYREADNTVSTLAEEMGEFSSLSWQDRQGFERAFEKYNTDSETITNRIKLLDEQINMINKKIKSKKIWLIAGIAAIVIFVVVLIIVLLQLIQK